MQGGGGGSGGKKKEDVIKEFIIKFLEQLPADFSLLDIGLKAKNKTPYVVVCLQECERMNTLLQEIRRSLIELDAGLKGQLNITDVMESLGNCLALNMVPPGWEKFAYFSKKNLVDWFADMLLRVEQFANWSEELITPKVLWISGLFNPMSFLTAIMQITAREKGLPLDNMCLKTDVMNTKDAEEVGPDPESGAFISGYFLEGAGWEAGRSGEQGYLTEMQLKDLHPELPIMHVTAVPQQERTTVGYYQCPVYVTSMRGPTFVYTAYLKMESEDSDPRKWILAGVALLQAPE